MNKLRLIPVLLPTGDASPIYINGLTDKLFIKSHDPLAVSEPNRLYRHLYLVSQREIKEGDWVCNGEIVFKVLKLCLLIGHEKKIESTTDPKLFAAGVCAIPEKASLPIPFYPDNSISQFYEVNFLEEFCKRYNESKTFERLEEVWGDDKDGEYAKLYVEKLADEYQNKKGIHAEWGGFVDGYTQALLDNKKKFTLEDMKTAAPKGDVTMWCETEERMGYNGKDSLIIKLINNQPIIHFDL